MQQEDNPAAPYPLEDEEGEESIDRNVMANIFNLSNRHSDK